MSPRETVHAIAAEFGVTYDELVGPRRYQRIVAMRSVVAERLRAQRMSLPDIGKALGGRHHTTVMNLLGLFDKPRKSPRKSPPCCDSGHLCKDSA